MQDYFPTKLAQGLQFCNRSKEKAALHENCKKCRHTVLIAPRRYGKSSLVFKVVDESSMPFASIDLFLAHDDQAITKRILIRVQWNNHRKCPFRVPKILSSPCYI